MNVRAHPGRLVGGLTRTFLLVACAVGLGLASVAAATPAPSPATPSAGPTVLYDASTAVNLHIEEPECVTGEEGTTTYANGVRQLRGWTRHCRYDTADPRFSGWSDIVLDADCYSEDPDCVRWGTERIPGPDGDWVGTYLGVGFSGDTGGARGNMAVLEGTGAYEGWTIVWYMDMAALGGEEWVIDGLIYQGPPPPLPPLPSPAAG